jgi:hypothetical protein
MITPKIANYLTIDVEGADMTKATNIEFYIRQGNLFFQKTPTVLSATQMLIEITYDEAMQLKSFSCAKLQFAFTDENGCSRNCDILTVSVDDLLKSEGYNGE